MAGLDGRPEAKIPGALESGNPAQDWIVDWRNGAGPWSIDALALHGRLDLRDAVEQARGADPPEPLVHGDELGLPPGPEIGKLLELIAEERAAGTISTREEALELVRRAR